MTMSDGGVIGGHRAARFLDSRAAYMMFVTTTNEKPAIAGRVGRELAHVGPGEHALRVLDAGMGDATVLTQLMRRMHQTFPHIPWLVVGKEISLEDVRQALDKLPDRLVEHPELVFAVTNMYYREAPALAPAEGRDLRWRAVPLEGSTAHDFDRQIRELYPVLADDWRVRTSARTGNPVYEHPAVLVVYRRDREFLLRHVIPKPGETEGRYELIIASHPYRARASAEHKVRTVLAPLVEALAPGGRLVGIHAHGDDPGLEIVRGVWPDEDPFRVGRHELLAEAALRLDGDGDLDFDALTDEESIFRYEIHAMPSEAAEHIGTSSILAAWNAAVYVAQIDEARLAEAMESGVYVEATRRVVRKYGRVWFNDESYVVSRRRAGSGT